MKTLYTIKSLTALVCSIILTSFVLAHAADSSTKNDNSPAGSLIKADAAGVSAEWLTKAKAEYPLDACMVSGDKLEGGDMGPPLDYVYWQEGQPDRLIRFCCPHCLRDFKKDAAKFLKQLDDAFAAKAKAAPSK